MVAARVLRQRGVPGREPPEQQDEGGDGDDEVERAVEEVPELDEPPGAEERLLHALLEVEAQRLLHRITRRAWEKAWAAETDAEPWVLRMKLYTP